jgi:hypothetical protein
MLAFQLLIIKPAPPKWPEFYYKPSQKSKIFGLEAGLPAEMPLKFKGLAGKPASKPQLYLFLRWLVESSCFNALTVFTLESREAFNRTVWRH